MTAVKTAISLDPELLEQIDETARELGLPRSQLLAMAAEKLIRDRENAKLLQRLNESYSDENDETCDESGVVEAWRRRHRELVESET